MDTQEQPDEREEGAKRGRPFKFQEVEELEAAISTYFKSCEERWDEVTDYVAKKDSSHKEIVKAGKVQYDKVVRMVKRPAQVPTVSGLAVACGTSRRTLLDYEARGDDDEFSHTIKKAKNAIEQMVETLLLNGGAIPAGVIFNLKNNWAWQDRTEVDNSGETTVNLRSTTDGELADLIGRTVSRTPRKRD